MTKDEVLKLALEALKQIDEAMPFPVAKLAQKAIREALAQPELTLDGLTPTEFALRELYEFQEATGCDTAAEFKAQPKQKPVPASDTSQERVDETAKQRHEQEPVAFYVYKPTLPRGHLGNVSDGDLPWVYDQDPSSGYSARMLVYTTPPQRKPLPSWIAYDEQQDVLTIHGRRYSAGLFDERGFGSPPGTLLRIVDGPSYVVTLERVAEQPAQQQEPVADECDSPEICRVARQCCGQYGTKNLCASTPPPRKPLTDEEIETLWQNTSPYYDHQDFARAIEAAHGIKEKNT